MANPRREIVKDDEVRSYHCVSRCVRRAFLCGFDKLTGKNFDHRKEWVEQKINQLTKGFFIEVGAYAVMSNHLHLVIKTRPDLTIKLSAEEILKAWNQIFPKKVSGIPRDLTQDEIDVLSKDTKRIEELRYRLSSVSWFMRCLSEYIARRANREDKCKGRFWEGRFWCQALLDEGAQMACMSYVDLNPIRAGISDSLENSQFTSIKKRIEVFQSQERIASIKKQKKLSLKQKQSLDYEESRIQAGTWLGFLNDKKDASFEPFVNISTNEYIELLEWAGRNFVEGKRGKIPDNLESILIRMKVNNKEWLRTVKSYGSIFYRIAGSFEKVSAQAESAGKKWFCGLRSMKNIFMS